MINAKKIFSKSLLALPMLALCGSFAACSDDDVVASAVDTKPLPTENWKDTSYEPGDNFFMYANGKFWKEHELTNPYINGFLPTEMSEFAEQLLENSNVYQPKTVWKNFLEQVGAGNYDEAAHEPYARAEISAYIARINGAESKEELAEAIAGIIEDGGNTIFYPALTFWGDEEVWLKDVSTWMLTVNESALKCLSSSAHFAPVLEMLGVDAEDAEEQSALALEWYAAATADSATSSAAKRLSAVGQPPLSSEAGDRFAPSFGPRQAPLDAQALPAVDNEIPADRFDQLVASALGHTDYYSPGSRLPDSFTKDDILDDNLDEYYQMFDALTLEQLKAISVCVAALDYLCVSPTACKAFFPIAVAASTQKLLAEQTLSMERLLAYTQNYNEQQVFFTQETRQAYVEMCEEFRTALSARIEKLDWMSATTKAKAQEKLAAMTFYVGGPSDWETEAFVSLDGTMYQNVQSARQKGLLLTRRIPLHEHGDTWWQTDLIRNWSSISDANAYYNSGFNSLIILPIFLTEKCFSTAASDAFNYGIAAVIGHEMTHGFDSTGAKYDKDGVRADWWTVDDGMEFQDRYQKLITTYNNFQTYPEENPDLYCDGENTLGENIADLGGLLIAIDAYTAHATRQGFYGEELQKQQRKVIETFAEFFRAKYTMKMVEYAKTDTHALYRERVNGMVVNIDAWYDLYNVQPGHRLYLSPSRRAYIW